MCSASSCVKMLCLNSALPLGSIHAQVKNRIWSGNLCMGWERERLACFEVSIQIKKNRKKSFFLKWQVHFQWAWEHYFCSPNSLSLVLSCGIQEFSSNLLLSGTEMCLSQDSNEYSWNTLPLFTQLWNTKQKMYQSTMTLQEVLSSTKLSCGNDRYSTFIKYPAQASECGHRRVHLNSGPPDLIITWLITSCVDNSSLLKLFSSWCCHLLK